MQNLVNALFQQGLFSVREKLQRMHARDFVRAVAGYGLEIAIPAQKPAALIVEIKNTRHAVDHGLRERKLASGQQLGLFTLTGIGKPVQGQRDIHHHFLQQGHFVAAEKVHLARIDTEHGDHLATLQQRQCGA